MPYSSMTNVLTRIIVNSRGCFTTDLQSTNCITNVTTNSWTQRILKCNRMHLSDGKISLMLRKANLPTIRSLLTFIRRLFSVAKNSD